VEQLFNAEFVADVNALISDLPVVESSPQLGAFD
jgi:hypothetical protein